MHRRGKILITESFIFLLIGVKFGDVFSNYLLRVLKELFGTLNADQVGIIFLNYDSFNRFFMFSFGILFCTFGMSIGLLIDRILEMPKKSDRLDS